MNTEVILKVDKLENLVAWIARNFVCGVCNGFKLR